MYRQPVSTIRRAAGIDIDGINTTATDIRHATSRSLSSGHHIMASTKPWYAPLVRVLVMCVVLATLQWLTATNYDLALRGEAGTLAGMVLVYSLAEFLRT